MYIFQFHRKNIQSNLFGSVGQENCTCSFAFAEDECFTRYLLHFTFYLLLVTFYSLLVTFCMLLVTFYSLLLTHYSSLLSCYFLPVTRCFFSCYSLLFIRSLLITTYWLLSTLLFLVTTYSLLINFYSLFLFINFCYLLVKLWKLSDVKNLNKSQYASKLHIKRLTEFQNLFQSSINNFRSPRNAVKLIGKAYVSTKYEAAISELQAAFESLFAWFKRGQYCSI